MFSILPEELAVRFSFHVTLLSLVASAVLFVPALLYFPRSEGTPGIGSETQAGRGAGAGQLCTPPVRRYEFS